MLTTPILQLESRLKAIENYLQLYTQWEASTSTPQLQSPELVDRAFRHCSIITNLYSLWESFVKKALSSWLLRLPQYFKFGDLSENLRNKYRSAIASLLAEFARREFRHLDLISVIQTYSNALQGNTNWGFVIDALTMHDCNIRKAQISHLFGSVEIPDIWHQIEKDFEVVSKKDSIDENVNAEKLLDNFVDYRNDASHGAPVDLLGPELLRQWIYFIRALCNAINRALTLNALHHEKKFHSDTMFGKVMENHRNNIVVLRLVQGKKIKIEDSFYFYRPNSYTIAKVLSIQINDVPVNEFINPSAQVEIGLGLSKKVQKNAEMIRAAFT